MHKFHKRRMGSIARRLRLDQERDRVRAMARSGKYSRHEIAIAVGLPYEQVCELTKHINMSAKKRQASEYGHMRWLENIRNQQTAEDEEATLDLTEFYPTDAPTGSSEKIEVLRRRLESNQPLWHPQDRVDYSGFSDSVLPSHLTFVNPPR